MKIKITVFSSATQWSFFTGGGGGNRGGGLHCGEMASLITSAEKPWLNVQVMVSLFLSGSLR